MTGLLWWATAQAQPVDLIRTAVDTQRAAFAPCGSLAAAQGDQTVAVELTVAPNGQPTVHTPAGETLTERQRCVAEKLAELTLPASTEGASARIQFALAFAHPGSAPTVQDPMILVGLDRSLIDPVIRADLAQIKRCYQLRLDDDPVLTGKLVVKFTIAKDGSVSAAAVKTSTLYDPTMEACVVERFERLQFPTPQGGGIVIVSYPFLFTPDAKPIPAAVAPAVEACVATVESRNGEPSEPLVFEVQYERRRAASVRIGTERYEHLAACIYGAVQDLRLPKGSDASRTVFAGTHPGDEHGARR
jgi:hypothetical protein